MTRPRSGGCTRSPTGKIFGNAFSEKGSLAVGSLVFNTRLLPDRRGGFRLDGEKFYSTGTLFSDYLTVAATTDHDSVATVVVPADRTGVRLIDDWDGFGQRRTGTGTTIFTTWRCRPTRSFPTRPMTPTRCRPCSTRRCSCTSTPWSQASWPPSSTTGWRCCDRATAASATH